MRKSLLAALMASATISLGALPGHTATTNVLRGTASETVSAAPAAPGTVNVIRGGSDPAGKAPAPKAVKAVTRPDLYVAAGGNILWLVAPKTGLFVACSLRGSSTVGLNKIHCTRARSR